MSMSRFLNCLLLIYREPPTLSNFSMAASKCSNITTFFACMSFLMIFTVKFGTTWKILNASLFWSCAGLLFWVFKDCLRIFVMFVNLICTKLSLLQVRVLTMSSLPLFSLSVLMWGANYCFGMHAYALWRIRGTYRGKKWGRRGGRGFPLSFLKIEKIALIMGKKCLVHPWMKYVHLCSHLKCYFKSTYEEKVRGFLSCVADEMFIEMPLF